MKTKENWSGECHRHPLGSTNDTYHGNGKHKSNTGTLHSFHRVVVLLRHVRTGIIASTLPVSYKSLFKIRSQGPVPRVQIPYNRIRILGGDMQITSRR